VVRVEAIMAPDTCFAPSTAAFAGDRPVFLSRYMFSITTILLSTSIPTPKARPAKDITFRVTLLKYIRVTANIRLIGNTKGYNNCWPYIPSEIESKQQWPTDHQ
jgi:hypothetical protein